MKKRLLQLAALGILCACLIYVVNRLSDHRADKKNVLPMKGKFFAWRDYDIFYNVKGTGKPILLIHDLIPSASNYEWTKLVRRLEKEYTVYGIDLPGCGRSDKPAITYTTYFYAELITAFIDQVIGEETTVIASGTSAFPSIVADKLSQNKINKLILINPERIQTSEQKPDRMSKFLKFAISLPIIGTYIYNIETSEKNLSDLFRKRFFKSPNRVDQKIVEGYYEAARRGHGTGRYLLASLRGHFLNTNIRTTLATLDNLAIVTSRDRKGSVTIQNEYRKCAKKMESTSISGSRTLPQLETPDKLYSALKLFLPVSANS